MSPLLLFNLGIEELDQFQIEIEPYLSNENRSQSHSTFNRLISRFHEIINHNTHYNTPDKLPQSTINPIDSHMTTPHSPKTLSFLDQQAIKHRQQIIERNHHQQQQFDNTIPIISSHNHLLPSHWVNEISDVISTNSVLSTIPPASSVYIARVKSPLSDGRMDYSNKLKKYFKYPRVLKNGDVFAIPAVNCKRFEIISRGFNTNFFSPLSLLYIYFSIIRSICRI